MTKTTEPANVEIINNINSLTENKTTKEEKFYSPENYDKLRNLQIDIYKKTGFTPSFQTIINLLITMENLKKLELNMINSLKLNNV